MTPESRAALREWRETEADFIAWYKHHTEEPKVKEKKPMAHELGNGQGLLFPQKAQGKQPDYSGRIMVKGELIKLVGWTKQGRNGPFISFKVDEPRRPDTESANNIDF